MTLKQLLEIRKSGQAPIGVYLAPVEIKDPSRPTIVLPRITRDFDFRPLFGLEVCVVGYNPDLVDQILRIKPWSLFVWNGSTKSPVMHAIVMWGRRVFKPASFNFDWLG